MAIHEDEVSMARGALPEYLKLAHAGIEQGGLGFPVSTLLFAVIDAIGSYHREKPGFSVVIDGERATITRPREHFRILNAPYFGGERGLGLTGEQIGRVYGLARGPVTHNAQVGAGCVLTEDTDASRPIEERDHIISVHLPVLWEACRVAVELFLRDAETIIPDSRPVKELQDRESYDDQVARVIAEWKTTGLRWDAGMITNVTAMGRPIPPKSDFRR